eukprot:TRINITY_DN71103_c0_g1_i1.p1 TRINITY_DN71103_c0_g1~~TRINITY_DN71103_c0_g1_i1.p1  ORF type:complete len:488 (+),score=107.28 TRINITY_DN71103_c0_g1_i1:71-1534(+)
MALSQSMRLRQLLKAGGPQHQGSLRVQGGVHAFRSPAAAGRLQGSDKSSAARRWWPAVPVQAPRHFSTSSSSSSAAAAASASPGSLPDDSVASLVATMERARQQAADMGYASYDVYEPYLPIDLGQQAFLALHNLAGDGCLAVVAAALFLRVVTWPLNKRALKRQCDKITLMPTYVNLTKALQNAKARQGGAGGGGPRGAEQAEIDIALINKKLQDFAQTMQFNPMQGMGYQFLFMLPLHVLSYFCLRGIIAHPDSFRSLVNSPTLWLDSITFCDPYGILPVMSAAAMLLNSEINTPPPQPGQEDTAVYVKFAIRGAVLTWIPLQALLPAAMVVFIGTNATYTALSMYIYKRYTWQPPTVDSRWDVPAEMLTTPGPVQAAAASLASQDAAEAPATATHAVEVKPGETFEVRVEKKEGALLGFSFGQESLRVTVLGQGLLAEWNEQNPDRTVRVGDIVVEVNGHDEPAKMTEELKKLETLRIVFRRAD